EPYQRFSDGIIRLTLYSFPICQLSIRPERSVRFLPQLNWLFRLRSGHNHRRPFSCSASLNHNQQFPIRSHGLARRWLDHAWICGFRRPRFRRTASSARKNRDCISAIPRYFSVPEKNCIPSVCGSSNPVVPNFYLENKMAIAELLLPEFDEEIRKTRIALERVPADKKDFTPHPKSMPMAKLAPHVAELAGFGVSVLTTPEFDFASGSYKPLPFESNAQLVKVFDEGSAKARAALAAL